MSDSLYEPPSMHTKPAGTYDVYVLTPATPTQCVPPLTSYVIPPRAVNGGD